MKALLRLSYRINKLFWRITKPITVSVRLILVKDGTVLLVKHTYQPHWYLSGGGIKKGETIEQAARRETAEELGAELGDLHLVGVYTSFYEHKSDHIIVLSCDNFTLTSKRDREIECFDFFRLDDLPSDISPGSLRRIQEYANGGSLSVVGLW